MNKSIKITCLGQDLLHLACEKSNCEQNNYSYFQMEDEPAVQNPIDLQFKSLILTSSALYIIISL